MFFVVVDDDDDDVVFFCFFFSLWLWSAILNKTTPNLLPAYVSSDAYWRDRMPQTMVIKWILIKVVSSVVSVLRASSQQLNNKQQINNNKGNTHVLSKGSTATVLV